MPLENCETKLKIVQREKKVTALRILKTGRLSDFSDLDDVGFLLTYSAEMQR